jgi:hypothetical protein
MISCPQLSFNYLSIIFSSPLCSKVLAENIPAVTCFPIRYGTVAFLPGSRKAWGKALLPVPACV